MARQRRSAEIGLAAIAIEGGLLTPEQLAAVAATPADARSAADYGCPRGTSLRDEITRYFRIAQAHWLDYSRIAAPDARQTARFAKALLEEAFGFEGLMGPVSHRRGEHVYTISLEGKDGRVPIVAAAPIDDTDAFTRALPQLGDGPGGLPRRSPAVLLQEWLNANPDFLWGLAFAGDRLRLMRDNASFTRPAFIEADLGAIFRDEMFADFTALWLLIHASRFGPAGAPAADSALERWREAGQRTGTAARERLRGNVEEALLALGQGFLDSNPALRARLDDGSLTMTAWFEQLLRTVYRLIFLAVAEDRDLLHAPSAPPVARDLYGEGYGFGALRERSARRSARDRHADAWEGMKIVFRALGRGEPVLGLPALGGLFAPGLTPDLDEAALPNHAFLGAVFRLSWLIQGGSRIRINWRDMATEELGSVYEGLLELVPTREEEGRRFAFAGGAEARGNARKVSGSYYTPDSLVQALLDSALDPLLARAEAEGGAEAILDLKVIDPACGSGHFLLGAARRMANRIAILRDPDAPDYQAAMRDVVRRSIHGVDRNSMAVELAKVALWIEAIEPGKPLGFLDANIRCGDALLGVFDLKALEEGIPDDAYKAVGTDDPKTARGLTRLNRTEATAGLLRRAISAGSLATEFSAMLEMPEDTVEQIERKSRARAKLELSPDWWSLRQACDAWTAAFFAPKPPLPSAQDRPLVPTTRHVWEALDRRPAQGLLAAEIDRVTNEIAALHWPLAFPDVMIGRGGFDLVFGNPPWDTMSPDVKEWFAVFDPAIRFMSPPDQARRKDELLLSTGVAEAWEAHQEHLYRAANFMRNSGRYRLFAEGNLGKGDFNVYRMFVELAFSATRTGGTAAQFVPENFYNGANAAALRHYLFGHMRLDALIAFENTKQVWFDIDSRQKFCFYSASRGGQTQVIPAAFRISSEAKLAGLSPPLPFQIPVTVVWEFSPEAAAIPELVHPFDLEIAQRLQMRLPPFGAAQQGANDRVYMRELDMGTDRLLFGDAAGGIPLYEGRMVEAHDYRAKAYVSGRGRKAVWAELPFGTCGKAIIPQWYVDRNDVPMKVAARWSEFRIGFCDVASPTNSRALVAALIPPGVLCGDKVPTVMFQPPDPRLDLLWLGLANSFCLDFVVRQKISLKMAFNVVDTLPLPRRFTNTPVEYEIARLALRLNCAGSEMDAFRARAADLCGFGECPPVEDPEERARLAAQLDVNVARDFFGLTRDQMRYLMDPCALLGDGCGVETFGALKRAEMRRDGRFTSLDAILAAWDEVDVPR